MNKKETNFYDLLVSIKSTIQFLLTKWWKIGIITLLCIALGFTYGWFTKPKYEAEITFSLEEKSGGIQSAYAGIASQFGVDLSGGGDGLFSQENIQEFMKSKKIFFKTMLTECNECKPEFNNLANYYLGKLKKDNKKITDVRYESSYIVGSDRFKDSVLNLMHKDISIAFNVAKIDKKIDIIKAGFVSSDELFSKKFIDNVTKIVIEYYTGYKNTKYKNNVDILQHQVDSVKALLTGDVTAIAVNNDLNVNPLKQTVRIPSQRRQMDVQTNVLVLGELLKQLELARIMFRKQTPLIQIVDEPVYPLKKKRLGRLMGGLIFGFLGFSFSVAYFLIKRYIHNNQKVSNN